MLGALRNALQFAKYLKHGNKVRPTTVASVIDDPARLLAPVGARGQTFGQMNNARMAADKLANDSLMQNLILYTPDLMSGVGAAAYMPEEADLLDRIGTGALTAGGLALGGRTARKLLGNRGGQFGAIAADFVGGDVGYHGSQILGEGLQRAKRGGTTVYEDMDQKYRAEVEKQLLAQHGLGGYNLTDVQVDPLLAALGLA